MEYNPFSIEGRTILVTGASSGIGKATSIECSKMGAKVIITGRNEERLKDTFSQLSGEGHRIIVSDLSKDDDIERLVKEIDIVDGIVLCAGVALTLPIQFSTLEKFEDIFNINFFAQTELMRLAYKKKKVAKGGSIVVISSIGGNYDFTIGNAVYGASKRALSSFV